MPEVNTTVANIEGGVKFCTELKISAKDMSEWTADQIALFFDGITKALRAVHEPNSTVEA